jgi:hypothetical protein
MTTFVKWNSLNQFHEVMKAINYRKYSDWLATEMNNKLTYFGKIKMHGTNASVTITPDGKVIAGKRSSFLPEGGTGGDNAGFAAWVKNNAEAFLALREGFEDHVTLTIYGEWCGPGVQSNVACSMTDRKMFYVFCADTTTSTSHTRLYEPDAIRFELTALDAIDDVLILPFHCKIELDFTDADAMRQTLENLNKEVEAIGERDPFMYENFEIDGAGEGLVFYPVLNEDGWSYDTPEQMELFSAFNFKAKSEHHRVNKTKTAVAANPEKIATLKNFAEMFCTPQRFEQAFDEAVGRVKDMKLTGQYIKWVCIDVMKESETEREGLSLEWKALAGAVSSRAAEWYKHKCQEV